MEEQNQHQRYRILLVEDDPHVRDSFKMLLEFDWHEVVAVDQGYAALAMLEQEKFDVVITDYWMPQMKGDELAGIIRHGWPNLPVIMASGSMANSSTVESLIYGVDFLLNKPFSLVELREAITWVFDLYAGVKNDQQRNYKKPGRPPNSLGHLRRELY